MTVKKIPMRMCTGCHEMKPKKELIRVVKTPEGEIKLDFTGKLKSLSRAFSCPISDEIYEQLKGAIEKGE